jgi:hypothetical protein
MICRASWDSRRRVIVLTDGHTFARGLTQTIHATFAPQLSHVPLTKKRRQFHNGRASGTEVGLLVDRQVEQWVNRNKYFTMPHPMFLEIRKVLSGRSWVPIVAQLPVGCDKLRLGTKIDLLCRDSNLQLVILEIKCGFDGYYDTETDARMLAPFEKVACTFRNLHFIQLMLTSWLFSHQHTANYNHQLTPSYILRLFHDPADDITYELCALPESGCAEQVIATLLANRDMTKKARALLLKK